MSGRASKDRVVWGATSFWMNMLPLHFGRYRGIFAEKGIQLEIEYFHGGPELAGEVKKGSIEIGSLGVPPFAKAFSEGMPAKVVGSTIIQKLDHYLVGVPEIKSMSDLKGRRIGILSFGSCDNYFIRHMLEKESIDPAREVELVPLAKSYGDLSCIKSKEVDAAFLVEPKVSQGESRGMLHVLARVGDYYPAYQWCIIFATEKLIREDSDLIRRVLDAYRRSCRSIRENPEECVSYGSRLFKTGKEVFRRALERNLCNWEIDARVDPAGFENAVEIQKQIGEVGCDLKVQEMVCNLER